MPLTRNRHLSRYRQIAASLARHGLGWLIPELGLGDLIPFHKGMLGHPQRDEPYTRPEHFRMVLEDLGVVFIKLGQVLSTRPDMLPPGYITEFARLQDAAPPVSYAEIAAVIEAELGAPPEAFYAEFDPAPRASASIGQAHTARLKDGTPVVVKMQRPASKEEVLAAFRAAPRIAFLRMSEGMVALNSTLELMSDLGRQRGDMWEVGLWEDSLAVNGNELFYNYQVYNQAIVVPETIDAIRALTGSEHDAATSIAKTDEALGLVQEFV